MKALLVSGGDIEDLDLLKNLANDMDFVIGVDRGTEYCFATGILPDIVIGDLDSINKKGLQIIQEKQIPIIKYPTEKNKTDTELAIDYLIEKQFKNITIIGAIGSRMDHTLGNIFLLKKLKDKKIKGKIIDGHNTIYLVDDELTMKSKKNSYVSLLPINDNGVIATLKGFKYNLDKAKIDFTSTLGISNKLEQNYGLIKIHKGICLVFVTID